MNNTLIRPACRDDFSALGVIGPSAYAESYNYAWDHPAAYAAYLHTFSHRALDSLPQDTLIWVAEVDGWIVGFLQMRLHSLDPIEHRPKGAEIQRIYLLKPARGRGLGAKLLDAAQAAAVSAGADYLWLVTMRSAKWALRTYERWGFGRIGKLEFAKPVRSEEHHLLVLRREIDPTATCLRRAGWDSKS